MMTRQECIERYGEIDFATKYWAEKRDWIVMYQVPEGYFPNWKVLDTNMPVRRIACNRDILEPLSFALEKVYSVGLNEELFTFDGCFNIRLVRGSKTRFSAHSYGLALDFNAKFNPLGSSYSQFHQLPEFVKCFKDAGFFWGGDFKKRPDPMHFSWTGF